MLIASYIRRPNSRTERLPFEGSPAVQIVGLPSVAIGNLGGGVNRVFPTDDGQGNSRVVVTPDNLFARENGWPDDKYLRQGVRPNGWVFCVAFHSVTKYGNN